MVVAYQGMVKDGQIRLEGDQVLSDGAVVIVVIVKESAQRESEYLTGHELAQSELVGLWADREVRKEPE